VKLDGMTKAEMADVMAKYKIVSPVTGNPLSGNASWPCSHLFLPVYDSFCSGLPSFKSSVPGFLPNNFYSTVALMILR
jgi:hypothetical protein